ncbi:MAG TPA: DUF2569 family protein [Candidatus Paceibacterota bacterium]|nr:DUF2569 family protein [Candidatus Paceibacterota bacterium]
MFCPHCGTARRGGDKFCASCGASFSGTPVQAATQTEPVSAERIGGWLILVALGLFLAPFLLAYGAFDSLSMLSDGGFDVLEQAVPGLGIAIAIELVIDVVLIFVTVYLLFLFKDKKRIFPKYYRWYLIGAMAYLFLDYVTLLSLSTPYAEMQEILDETIAETTPSVIAGAISSAIWIAYTLKSKRVARTFVN